MNHLEKQIDDLHRHTHNMLRIHSLHHGSNRERVHKGFHFLPTRDKLRLHSYHLTALESQHANQAHCGRLKAAWKARRKERRDRMALGILRVSLWAMWKGRQPDDRRPHSHNMLH